MVIKLRDILQLYNNIYDLPDTWERWEDIRPNSVYRIKLAFMCEEETHILTHPLHPALIPFYDCDVSAIDVDGEDTLRVWLNYETFMPTLIERNKGW